MSATIERDDCMRVGLRVGRVITAKPFPAARRPAYVLQTDVGAETGVRKSSAQITEHDAPETLTGRLVVGVINVPPRQIGPLTSECLTTGFHDAGGPVRRCMPDGAVAPGARLL